MRTVSQIENEVDRLLELKEHISFIVSSLLNKAEYLREIFQMDTEIKKAYELTSDIKEDLESSVVSFLAGNSTYTNFDLSCPEEA